MSLCPLATPTIGFSKSPSSKPTARNMARFGARFGPSVISLLREFSPLFVMVLL
jgi:hypothetical protein